MPFTFTCPARATTARTTQRTLVQGQDYYDARRACSYCSAHHDGDGDTTPVTFPTGVTLEYLPEGGVLVHLPDTPFARDWLARHASAAAPTAARGSNDETKPETSGAADAKPSN